MKVPLPRDQPKWNHLSTFQRQDQVLQRKLDHDLFACHHQQSKPVKMWHKFIEINYLHSKNNYTRIKATWKCILDSVIKLKLKSEKLSKIRVNKPTRNIRDQLWDEPICFSILRYLNPFFKHSSSYFRFSKSKLYVLVIDLMKNISICI